MIKVKRNNK